MASLLYCDQYFNLFFVNLYFFNLPSHINFNGTEWLVSAEVPSRNYSLSHTRTHALLNNIHLYVSYTVWCVSFNPQMQTEADRLKRLTKVVVLGIGSGVSLDELNNIASAPVARNVIRVHNFSRLRDVEEQLRNTSCIQPPTGNSSMSRICNIEKKMPVWKSCYFERNCIYTWFKHGSIEKYRRWIMQYLCYLPKTVKLF